MRTSLKIDATLLQRIQDITGLSKEAAVDEAMRHLIGHHQRPTFETLAAEFRALTAGRKHTPSEILLQEDRDRHAY